MKPTVPFLKTRLTGNISVEFQGKSIIDSKVNLSLVVTEENSATIIEDLTPRILALASQIGEVLAEKIAEAEESKKNEPDSFESFFKRQSTQKNKSDLFSSLFGKLPND